MIWVSYQIGGKLDEPCGFSGDHWQMQQCFNVGLNLFNDDTRPSGHISRPTQVNVSQELLSFSKKPSYTGKCVSELLSFSKQLLKSDHIVHVWGLVEVNKLHHIR